MKPSILDIALVQMLSINNITICQIISCVLASHCHVVCLIFFNAIHLVALVPASFCHIITLSQIQISMCPVPLSRVFAYDVGQESSCNRSCQTIFLFPELVECDA